MIPLDRRSFFASIASLILGCWFRPVGRKRIFGGDNDKIGLRWNYSDIYKCKVSVPLGREELYELGRIRPFYRYTDYPVKITEETLRV